MSKLSNVNLSNNILSKDKYFTQGLIDLLGAEFIDHFYFIVDLDFNDLSECAPVTQSKKSIVAFASNDFSFYKSAPYKEVPVLDKRSSESEILSFFLQRKMSGNYHTKFHLSQRERQMLTMLSRGESNEKIAEELGVKLKTIYTHRRNLMAKLGCKNRVIFHNLLLK